MPAAVLKNIPHGADVFLDANIFVYAINGLSNECKDLLNRCARGDVTGVTSLDTINEVTHRLMVAEAFDKGLISRPRADQLAVRPNVVQSLKDYWNQVERLFQLGLLLLRTEEATLRQANIVRLSHGLMTLGSVIVALMKEYGIEHLASHDAGFDVLPDMIVYHPTDVP